MTFMTQLEIDTIGIQNYVKKYVITWKIFVIYF